MIKNPNRVKEMLRDLDDAGILKKIICSTRGQCSITKGELKRTGFPARKAYDIITQLAHQGSKSLGKNSMNYTGKRAVLGEEVRGAIYSLVRTVDYQLS
jgi:hypothetical protein